MSELQSLLTEFAAGRVALVERHEASARAVSHYDFNNTYQYVINREETHLSWLQNALAEYKAVLPPAGPSALPAPQPPKVGKNIEASAFRGILEDAAAKTTGRTANEQKIGDAYAAMDERRAIKSLLRIGMV